MSRVLRRESWIGDQPSTTNWVAVLCITEHQRCVRTTIEEYVSRRGETGGETGEWP